MKKIIVLLCLLAWLGVSAKDLRDNFTGKYAPEAVGAKVCSRFIEVPHPNWGTDTTPTREITYPETCAWLGAIRYARTVNDREALRRLEDRFYTLFGRDRRLLPGIDHVDHNVFGTIPLQLFQLTGNRAYESMGLWYADSQWLKPDFKSWQPQELIDQYLADGLSWQTRYWIDDMFMITAVQTQAYLTTKDPKYLDRTAREMVSYLGKIQRPNGLFHHSPEAPYFWGRGNGWMAAGMTELLSVLPEDNEYRPVILESYRKMMDTLAGYQKPDGLWAQLVDDPGVWSETSGSAMFTYAMIKGVRQGWLPREKFEPVVVKAWKALVDHINDKGDIDEVCDGTNRNSDRNFYLGRPRLVGNMHGQAPVLWCATALLEDAAPGDSSDSSVASLGAQISVSGKDIAYASPSSGRITFGWDAPLTVDGVSRSLRIPYRYHNPYCTAPFSPDTLTISTPTRSLTLHR